MPGLRALVLVAALALAAPAGPAGALDLTLPGAAELTREEVSPADTYFLPVGPFADGNLPVRKLEGQITRQAWRIDGTDLTTLQLIAPMREQLQRAGYDIVLDCASDECGGFDFRFGTEILPAPDMFVDLFDFRFLAAQKRDGDGAEYLSGLVSRAGGAGYVQLVVVGAETATVVAPAGPPTRTALPEPGPQAPLVGRLVAEGYVILTDLEFASGKAALEERPYDSLAALARFLGADASRRIALVGHTDAVGGLAANLTLSRDRAAAVLERLAEVHGVSRAQIEAEGVGYLAPIASNLTAVGRDANRRVEAVLLSAGDSE